MKRSADFSCSLFKLRLKFVQTTRVVCTNLAEVLTLGKVHGTFFSLKFQYKTRQYQNKI